MSASANIRTGDTEPIEALIRDGSGEPLTGKTDITVTIRRKSDGFTYDWDDGNFKAFAACTTPRKALTEVDGANYPGEYATDFDTSVIANPADDDTYEVTVDQVPRTDASNVPQPGEIKVGQWADTIEFCRKLLNNKQWLYNGAANNLKTWDDDDSTLIANSDVTDVNGNPVSLEAGMPARRSRGT
jgi:hypothetical protein